MIRKIKIIPSEAELMFYEWHETINKELFNGTLSTPQIYLTILPKGVSGQYLGYCGFINMNFEEYKKSGNRIKKTKDEQERADLIEWYKRDFAGVLLHEMVHQYAKENGLKDGEIRNGTDYHTEVFKDLAENKGLMVLKARNGWSKTAIQPQHPILDKLVYKYDLDTKQTEEVIETIEE